MGDDTGFAAFIRSRPCSACGRRPSVVAHILTRGAEHGTRTRDGRPNVIPLCAVCHTRQHGGGWENFRTKYAPPGFDEWAIAADLAALFAPEEP